MAMRDVEDRHFRNAMAEKMGIASRDLEIELHSHSLGSLGPDKRGQQAISLAAWKPLRPRLRQSNARPLFEDD